MDRSNLGLSPPEGEEGGSGSCSGAGVATPSSPSRTTVGAYLLAKDDQAALLDYLSTLVAKEYVVYNNPRAASAEGEEMVRMLVRVRRQLPRRR